MLLTCLSLIAVFVTLLGQTRAGSVSVRYVEDRPHCTVIGNGNTTNDVPILKQAFHICGKHGNIIFPKDQDFWIAEKFNPVVDDVQIRWNGKWTVSNQSTPLTWASSIGRLTTLRSFRTISRTGGTTHIMWHSRITGPALYSPARTSPSTAGVPAE